MSFYIELRSMSVAKKDVHHQFGVSYWHLPGGYNAEQAIAMSAWFSTEEERSQFLQKYRDVRPYDVCKM